jgi:hypothetical protein
MEGFYLFYVFYLLNLTFHSITLIILGRRYIYWNFWKGYSPGFQCGGTEFDILLFHVGFVLDKLGQGQIFIFPNYFDRSLPESFHITIFHSCTLMLHNIAIEGVVISGMLSLSVSKLPIFRLPSSIPQYVISCLQETQQSCLIWVWYIKLWLCENLPKKIE